MMNMLLFFSGLTGRLTVIGSLIVALIGWRMYDVNNQRSIGERRNAAKVETATNEAVSKASRAAAKSSQSDTGGVRNPRYRD